MRTDSVFRIASMTKLVTSVAVMMLLEERKLSVDQPFAELLPGYEQPGVLDAFDSRTREYRTLPASSSVTVRQLLTHTSGYGYWFLNGPLRSLKTGAPEKFRPPFLTAEPGRRFAYGISTDVLGQIVEPLSGLPLDRFFAERILEPLGMSDTGYAPPSDARRLASVHARAGAGFDAQPNETAGPSPHGGGGLYSTAEDYLALLRLFLNHGESSGRRLLARESIEAMVRNQIGELAADVQRTVAPDYSNDFIFMDGSQKFGFGVLVETRDQPTGRTAGSYGWGGIRNTYFWVDPSAGIAGVVMMQTSPFADPRCVELYRGIERAVYSSL